MNAGLAKPIHRIWFIPERPLILIKSLPGPRLTRWVFAPLLASPWRDDPLRRSAPLRSNSFATHNSGVNVVSSVVASESADPNRTFAGTAPVQPSAAILAIP
jgi:hypothetical protein